jgi:peptidoglycan/LPS O-acetylase OafA/YrhL
MDKGAEAGRIPALDGWRGVAIGLVLWGHFFPVPGVNLGFLGVEFFFVLSGRLMAEILFVRKFPLPEFFWRRATRIMPALLAFLLIAFVAAYFIGTPFSPMWIVTSMTFTINYVMTVGHTYPNEWLQQLWSLCVEEHAYMLLGLIVVFFGRGRWKPLIVICILGLASMIDGAVSVWGFHQNVYDAYWRTDVHIDSIFLSVVIFLVLRHRLDTAWIKRSGLPIMLAALALGVLLSFEAVPVPLRYTLGTGSLALAVALVESVGPTIKRIFSFKPLTTLGVLSYSVYLYQEPFYHEAAKGKQPALLMLAFALAAGVASYYMVEQPSRKWLNKLWKRIKARKAPAVDAAPVTPSEPAKI